MISNSVLFGILFIIGLAAGQLVEVDDTSLNNSDRNEGNNEPQLPLGPSDFGPEDGGLEISGPKNPQLPGDALSNDVDIKVDDGKDKVINDPWRPFYDPDNKNPFGQTFPAPEDVPKVPKRPGHNFPDPDSESPFGQNPNGGFGQKPEAPGQGNAFPTNAPTHGTFEPYPTDAPTHGTFEPFPTERPIAGHHNQHNEPKPHITERPTTPKYDQHEDDQFPGIGGILGWKKHTTKKPFGLKPGGVIGGILGGWKDAVANNKEAVDKAKDSVKEAREKVADAGKDVLDAGWKIGESLFNPHKNKKKHSPVLQGLGRIFRALKVDLNEVNNDVVDNVDTDDNNIEVVQE